VSEPKQGELELAAAPETIMDESSRNPTAAPAEHAEEAEKVEIKQANDNDERSDPYKRTVGGRLKLKGNTKKKRKEKLSHEQKLDARCKKKSDRYAMVTGQ
jgi:hypothetical protein